MNTVGVIYRNPGGKPSKPGKPGGGKPFERPEGENWVIIWILSTTKSHQLLLVIWAENFIFTFRWGTGSRRRSDAREFPNSIALSFLTPTSIVTRFHPWHCDIIQCRNFPHHKVINMKATQCNHRKDVDKCPITLNTKVITIILSVINYDQLSC